MRAHFETDRGSGRGFSLVEVIVAIGLLGGTGVLIGGLLLPLLAEVRMMREWKTAERAADSVLARAEQDGFERVRRDKTLSAPPTDALDSLDAHLWWVDRSGGELREASGLEAMSGAARHAAGFFEVALVRDADLSPDESADSLGVWVFSVRVSWPAFLEDGRPNARDRRSTIEFRGSLRS